MPHHGPKDDYEYHTPRRLGGTVSITRFLPTTDATPADDEGSAADADVGTLLELVAPDETVVVINAKMGDGRTLIANVHWTDIAEAVGDDPTVETISLQFTGPYTVST